ncbi:MAG: C4-dicarboxylate TRAP transporter substrate-binding protein [Eubacteriales bacterium]|jgi:tripartite ATP-independent transporter DctP family solute receptor
MMKKILASALALTTVAALLSGCGGDTQTSTSTSGGDTQTSTSTSGSEDPKVTIKIGYENNPGEPTDLGCIKWEELAEEYSGGSIDVQLFPSSQMGAKKDILEQAMQGTGAVTLGDGSFWMDYVPDMGIVAAPYLFTDSEQYMKVRASDWWTDMKDQLAAQGLYMVADNWFYGSRETIAKKPITKPEDFKGMKIRTPNNELFTKAFELMGATPTPMPLGDVYTALQQGVVDGAENPLPVIYGSKQQEVVKDISLTQHILLFTQWCGGTDFFNGLTDAQREAFLKAGEEAGDYMTEETIKQTEECKQKFIDEGCTIHEDVDVAAFQEAVKPMYDSFENWTPGLYDTIVEIMNS